MIKNYLIKIGKILAAGAMIVALGSQVISAPQKGSATEPRFNFLPEDRELFQGLNFTKNETNYTDPITTTGDDEVAALVYYHNGEVNTVANNTTIKVTMPIDTNSKSKILGASISADNAATITDTIINQQIVGKSGLTVITPTADSTLSFVPGSVRWYPEKNESPVALPAGQTGDTILTTGVNIGNIQGCWDFSGFIVFKLKVNTPKPAQLEIDKTVKNPRVDESFVKSNTAIPGDQLDYQLVVSNPGLSKLENVLVKDTVPAGTTFIAGSVRYFPDGSTAPMPLTGGQNANNLVSSGVTINSLDTGSVKTAKFVFSVKVDSTGLDNGQKLVNTVTASSGNLSDSSQAETVVTVLTPNFVKSKSAFNITQNIDATKKSANPGDSIRYTLVTRNTGNAVGKVNVVDGIADILEYTEITDAGTGQIVNDPNNSNEDNRIVINFGEKSINISEEVAVSFVVKVKNPLPVTPPQGNHFDLTMYNVYGNSVVVKIQPPVITPILSLVKNVRNVTTNEINFSDEDEAVAGDVIEYQIIIKNSGNGPADAVKIVDTLPVNVAYISGTTVLSRDASANTLADGIVNGGVTLAEIQAGQTATIYFRARIDSGVQVNTYLVNSVTVTSGSKTLTDTAKTLVKAPIIKAVVVQPEIVKLPRTGGNGLIVSIVAVFGIAFLGALAIRKKFPTDLS